MGGVSVYAWSHRSVIDVKVDTKGCGLGEDVADLRFELGVDSVESSAAETELVLVVLRMINSWRFKEAVSRGRFPDEPAKIKMLTSSLWRRSDVLTTADMKEIELEGLLL